MPSFSDTAYPRFKINPSAKELNELYTPTVYELAFARERAREPLQRAGLLLLLKTFQRLEGVWKVLILSYFTDYLSPFQLPNSWGEPWSVLRES